MPSTSDGPMASAGLFAGAFCGKRVFVTGHTGFKGAWLCEWLLSLGATVTGYSLGVPTQPVLFEQAGLANRLTHREGDVRDAAGLAEAVAAAQPDFVFHLAAQALVRESYARPMETLAVNIMGTAHVLEALRSLRKPCAVVCVTSDKCYENRNWVYAYREEDAMGGHDPYSASKGAAELVIASLRRSFFHDHPVRVASARAGNVIGGGDWAPDRIVPDCVRALSAGQPIAVRNKWATRPWQHVLDCLSGYLWLGAVLSRPALVGGDTAKLSSAFNFGPAQEANRTVEDLVVEVLRHWPGRWEDRSDPGAPHEATMLQLAVDKARALLGWAPVWGFREAVAFTIGWYRGLSQAPDANAVEVLNVEQIRLYCEQGRTLRVAWALPARSTEPA